MIDKADHTTWSLFLPMTFIISWLILRTMLLLSLSSPASRQALSKSCRTTRLAYSGASFRNSFRRTISSLLLSNSNVMLRNSIRGLPAFACSYIMLFMNAICRIPDEIGEITSAGPYISLPETTTLST
jgi:hypothetical protein